jgi:hypothetical protein
MIGRHHLLRRNHWVEERNIDDAESHDVRVLANIPESQVRVSKFDAL